MQRLDHHKTQLGTLIQADSDKETRLGLIEDLLIHKNEKNSAFELINQKIAQAVCGYLILLFAIRT